MRHGHAPAYCLTPPRPPLRLAASQGEAFIAAKARVEEMEAAAAAAAEEAAAERQKREALEKELEDLSSLSSDDTDSDSVKNCVLNLVLQRPTVL